MDVRARKVRHLLTPPPHSTRPPLSSMSRSRDTSRDNVSNRLAAPCSCSRDWRATSGGCWLLSWSCTLLHHAQWCSSALPCRCVNDFPITSAHVTSGLTARFPVHVTTLIDDTASRVPRSRKLRHLISCSPLVAEPGTTLTLGKQTSAE